MRLKESSLYIQYIYFNTVMYIIRLFLFTAQHNSKLRQLVKLRQLMLVNIVITKIV